MNPVIDTPQGRCVPEKNRQSLVERKGIKQWRKN